MKRFVRDSRARCRCLRAGLLAFVILWGSQPDSAFAMGEGSTQFTALSGASEANLVTGDAVLSVPIQIPPGREGATPKVSLEYSSSGNDGPLGLGWSLPLGEVSRGTADGVPRCAGDYQSNSFVLSMPGVSSELNFRDGSSSPEFFVHYDEGYIEITADTTANSWTVRDRAGRTYTFGSSPAARSWTGADTFMDTTACEFTSVWSLTQIRDANGNTIDIDYVSEGNVSWVSSISYGANPTAGLTTHPFVIEFDRVSRSHSQVLYGKGIRQELSSLYSVIRVRYRQSVSAALEDVRSYSLVYDDAELGGRVLLESVAGTDMPTQTFEYLPHQVELSSAPQELGQVDLGRGHGWRISSSPDVSLSVRDTAMLDMNGDGIADFVGAPTAQALSIKYGQANGTFAGAPVYSWDASEIDWRGQVPHIQLSQGDDNGSESHTGTFDISGDGIPDFVDATPPASPGTPASWTVYLGACTSAVSCGFEPPIAWPAPEYGFNESMKIGGSTISENLVVDINGDAYVDFVVTAQTGPWTVFEGSGSGFASTGRSFAANGAAQVSRKVNIFGNLPPYGNAYGTLRQLFDFNGDGLPDQVYVSDDDVHETLGLVDIGGNLLVGPTVSWDYNASKRVATGCSLSVDCWLVGVLSVQLNTGTGFGPAIDSPLGYEFYWKDANYQDPNRWQDINRPSELRRTFEYCNYNHSNPPDATEWQCHSIAQSDFFDVNGDGLPDYVFGSFPQNRVLFNVGGGRLESGPDAIEVDYSSPPASQKFVQGGYIYPGDEKPVLPKRTVPGLPTPLRYNYSFVDLLNPDGLTYDHTEYAVMDLNGDGVQERLDASQGVGYLSEALVPVGGGRGKPGLLVRSTRSDGWEFEIQYSASNEFDNSGTDGAPDLPFSKWLVTATRHADGLCDPGSGVDRFDLTANLCVASGHEMHRRFSYSGGLFDRDTREFRGFAQAIETDTDGNDIIVTFSQEDGLFGKEIEREVRAGPHVLRRTTQLWMTNPSLLDPDRHIVYLAETKQEEFKVPDDDPTLNLCSVARNAPPDEYGRVSNTCAYECGNAPPLGAWCTPNVEGMHYAYSGWAEPVAGSHLREKPAQVFSGWVKDGQATLLSHEKFRYDGNAGGAPLASGEVSAGNVRWVESYRDVSETGPDDVWLLTSREYDAFGNVLSVTNPAGATATNVYSADAFSLYPTEAHAPTVNGVANRTLTTMDLRFGKSLTVTDANDQVSEYAYDSRGRTTCEAAPGDTVVGCHSGGSFPASREFHYRDGDPAGTTFESKLAEVEVRTVEPNAPNGYLSETIYMDALGRERLVKNERVIGASAPSSLTTVVSSQIEYDAEGRKAKIYEPYVGPAAVESPTVASTTLSYAALNGLGGVSDPLGRPRSITAPDGTVVTSWYEGLRQRQVDPSNREVWEERDAFGRVVSTRETGTGGHEIGFVYELDGADRVISRSVLGVAFSEIQFEFDTLGNRTGLIDRDAGGEWRFGYDDVGNLTYVEDPAPNQHIQHCFDDLGRQVLSCSFADDVFDGGACSAGCGSGTTEATLTYDDPAIPFSVGRLTRADDGTGYTEFEYDLQGRTSRIVKEVHGSAVVFEFHRDRAGHLTRVRYPYKEDALYTYNAAGQAISLLGEEEFWRTTHYLTDMDYDIHGRPEKIVHANGVEDVRQYGDASNAYRLERVTTTKTSSSSKYLDVSYAYNAIGKVEATTDHRDATGALSNAALYTYDGIARLSQVNNSQFNDAFDFDTAGNMTLKGGETLAYPVPAAGSALHQLSSVGGRAVTYNPNGGRATKELAGGGTQTYGYDRFGRLNSIDVSGGGAEPEVEISYDYAGDRVATQTDGGDHIRYFGKLVEVRSGEVTKHFFAGGLLIASTDQDAEHYAEAPLLAVPLEVYYAGVAFVVITMMLSCLPRPRTSRQHRRPALRVRAAGSIPIAILLLLPMQAFVPMTAWAGGGGSPPQTEIRHHHTDRLGSTQVVTDAAGQILNQLRYDAYGSVRFRGDAGGAPIADSGRLSHEFTGYDVEPLSGLQFANARYFDPETAQFLNPDPERQFASPFAYGPGDPLNGSDPSGRLWWAILPAFFANLGAALAVGAFVATVVRSAMAGDGAGVFMTLWGAALGGIVGAAIGPKLAAAAPEIGPIAESLVNAAANALNAYTSVQTIRGRDVAMGISIAGTAIGFAAMAYSSKAGAMANATTKDSDDLDRRLDEFLLGGEDGIHLAGADDGAVSGAIGQRGESKWDLVDFNTLQVNVAVPNGITATLLGIAITLTQDQNGRLYFGIGLTGGKSLTFVSGSFTAGGLAQRRNPGASELTSFLSGHAVNFAAGFGLGAGVVGAPDGRWATIQGYFTPQAGLDYTYSTRLR